MPEYRHDAILDRRVIVAADRAARPYTTADGADRRTGPDALPVLSRATSTRPRPRPVAPVTARPTRRAGASASCRTSTRSSARPEAGDATGAHEVVILCPDHDRDFAALDDDQATELFLVLRDRVRFHLDAGRAFASAFVNHGRGAGASIEHPHAQIVAPDRPAEAVVAMTERFTTDLVAARARRRPPRPTSWSSTGPRPAWCPPASWSPYQMRVAHRSTRARIDEATDAEIAVVARGHARRAAPRSHGRSPARRTT